MTSLPVALLRVAVLPLLFSVAACGRAVSREEMETRRAREREARPAAAVPEPSAFVARQSGAPAGPPVGAPSGVAAAAPIYAPVAAPTGAPMEGLSAVMQLHVSAADARITVTDVRARRASAGAAGELVEEQIPGSRASPQPRAPEGDAEGATAAPTTVRVPVLVGERYLVEVEPLTAAPALSLVALSADGVALSSIPFPTASSRDESALYEVAIGSRGVEIGPRIEGVELIPACGTLHTARSTGRASVYAQYHVVETGETGQLHLPPRAADARFRSVTFQTRTRGSVRITYLGYELASAPMPAECPPA